VGGNITGCRADLIVCDDVEVAGNGDTPGKRAELRERLAETEFVLVPGGTILYVGTPHHAESLYREEGEDSAAFLAGYRRLSVPLLDAAGRSAWWERFPPEAVAALRRRVGPLQFERHMLLRAVADAAARLDPAALVRYAEEPEYREANGRAVLSLLGQRLVSGGGFWDPAYGRPGDASVLAACYADAEGNHYLHRVAYLAHDPEARDDPATQQCHAVAAIARAALAGGAGGDERDRPVPARAAAAGDGAGGRGLRGGGTRQHAGQGGAHPRRAGAGARRAAAVRA
jgi:hypothetical protein